MKNDWSLGIIVIICVPFIYLYGSWYSKNVRLIPNNSQTDVPDNISVCLGAEELVKGRLVSPGSAKFLDCDDQEIVSVGTNKWQVSSYVDAQNSFGGLMRSNYVIVVEYKGNSTFHLDEVKEFTDGGQQ